MTRNPTLWQRVSDGYRLRWKRRRRLYRALRRRHDLQPVRHQVANIKPNDILLFSTMRNELARLPHFMSHYRELGVGHFLIVDNASDDGTQAFLERQEDVSLWTTNKSYRQASFGADWLAWLRIKYGSGRWCLTVDADEIFVYPQWPSRKLEHLAADLDRANLVAMGALMVDLYPKGPLNKQHYDPGSDPFELLCWFDGQDHIVQRQNLMGNLWVRGGVRARAFFADNLTRAPTMNKLPLVKWSRRYAYVNSTHAMLPRQLNSLYDGPGDRRLSGVLLHTKFLPSIGEKSQEEKRRGEHFGNPGDFDPYYDKLILGENLWNGESLKYKDWTQFVSLGWMSDGPSGDT